MDINETKKNEMNIVKDNGDRLFVNAYISVIRETMRSLYHLRAEEARMMGSIEEQTNEIQSKFWLFVQDVRVGDRISTLDIDGSTLGGIVIGVDKTALNPEITIVTQYGYSKITAGNATNMERIEVKTGKVKNDSKKEGF